MRITKSELKNIYIQVDAEIFSLQVCFLNTLYPVIILSHK